MMLLRSSHGIETMLKRLAKESNINCKAHRFRRGFWGHNLESGLSTGVVQAQAGWEQITMVDQCSKSLGCDDALTIYRKINGN
jgi:site-specific recombinase XerD